MSDKFAEEYENWKIAELDRKEEFRQNNWVFVPSHPPTPMYDKMDMKIIYEEEYKYRKTVIRELIKEDKIKDLYPQFQKTSEHFKIFEKIRQKNLKEKRGFLFITISPQKWSEEFKKEIFSIFSFCWVSEMYCVFEQRGDAPTNRGNGAHAHILIPDWDNEINKVRKQIQQKFKKFVGKNLYGQKLDEVINVLSKKTEWLEDKMEYILGEKTDEGKPQKQTQDIEWRKNEKLEKFYHFDNSTDKKELSIKGGKRSNSGVKKGQKRGNYKKEKFENIIIDKSKKIVNF
jgi:hypothetical protein